PVNIPVLCEREPAGDSWRSCNGGFCADIIETAPAKHYLFSFAALPRDQASAACGSLGGSLVVFESRQERETLLRSLLLHYDILATSDPSANAPNEVWIGYASDDAGTFGWDGDGGFDGSPCGDNQPSADASLPMRAYVDLNTDDYDVQLAHDDTDVPRPYICQY
ncbi:MAG: C-type lectin domain-containing protein, partial [Polyangiaceae bacterium]